MADRKDLLSTAHRMAMELEAAGLSGADGSQVLAMALGIFLEGQDGAHRDMQPMFRAMLEVGQTCFDALRASREVPNA